MKSGMKSGMTCPYCQGRGWSWRGGDVDNAYRQECEPCEGKGRGRVTFPLMVLPWLVSGVLWGLVLGGLSWLFTHGWDALAVIAGSNLP